MARSKPDLCYQMQCPLAVLCQCKHHEDFHPLHGHCTVMKDEVLCSCNGFQSKGKGFVLGVGNPLTAKLAIILEAPGKEEVSFSLEGKGAEGIIPSDEIERRRRDYPTLEGRFIKMGAPVVGRSGSLLNQWVLPKVNLERSDIFIDNTIRCVSKGTQIWMEDGSWKAIQKISLGEKVKCLVNNTIVERAVTETTRTPNRKNWFQVDVDGGYRRNQNGNKGVYLTYDHEWITPKGRVRTDQLSVGDDIILPQVGNNSLLHGTILGDGHVREDGFLMIAHSNIPWLESKAENFNAIMKNNLGSSGYPNAKPSKNIAVRIPRVWREKFYNKDRSKIWIDPPDNAALAVLYGDDGTRDISNDSANFAVQAFVPKYKEEILVWARERFGSGSIDKAGNLRLGTKAARNLYEQIANWLHPSMAYKLPNTFRGRYNNWMKLASFPLIGKVLTVSSVPYAKNKPFFNGSEMCLVVEEAQNFFTRCGLVSNCLPPPNKTGASYPIGEEKGKAEFCCRQYDRVQHFPGKVVEVSLHPASLLREVTPLPLLIKDFEKAVSFIRQGYKTVLLLGGRAADAFLGYADNVTRWRGHYEVLLSPLPVWYSKVVERLEKRMGKGKKSPSLGKAAVIENAVRGVEDDVLSTPSLPSPIYKKEKRGRRVRCKSCKTLGGHSGECSEV